MLPFRPAAFAEHTLITQFLAGHRPPNSLLPAERILALELGVTRPTLRETLKQLHRDGWIEIRHGKPTRVCDIWREGGLNILNGLRYADAALFRPMIDHLLAVRIVLVPAYTRDALLAKGQAFLDLLSTAPTVRETPSDFVDFDWRLHQELAQASGNPIYCLILNGFEGIYQRAAEQYFVLEAARRQSAQFYGMLAECITNQQWDRAVDGTAKAMQASRSLWQEMGG